MLWFRGGEGGVRKKEQERRREREREEREERSEGDREKEKEEEDRATTATPVQTLIFTQTTLIVYWERTLKDYTRTDNSRGWVRSFHQSNPYPAQPIRPQKTTIPPPSKIIPRAHFTVT